MSTPKAKVGLHSGGIRLGPMGEFTNQLIIKIELKVDFQTWANENLVKKIKIPRIFETSYLIRSIQNLIFIPFDAYVKNLINTNVPKDTGDLRKAMKDSIKDGGASNRSSFPLEININTAKIDYAKPVNRMPTDWLTHPTRVHFPNLSRRNSALGLPRTLILNDPKAQTNWFWTTVLNGRNKIFLLWKDYFNNVLLRNLKRWPNIFKDPRKTLRDIFKVTIPLGGRKVPP